MSINYEQLKMFVREELAEDAMPGAPASMVDSPGGMMAPSAPANVPHRMPAADPPKDKGDPVVNKLYDVALVAREATEKLVVALDEPIFDNAYEYAFKASASLRKALNSLEASGARPKAAQRVVAPPAGRQKYRDGASYQGPSAMGSVSAFGAHSPGVALSDISEASLDLATFSTKLKGVIEAYENLNDEELQLFAGYFAGDKLENPSMGAAIEEKVNK
jgi:hypothetical protein